MTDSTDQDPKPPSQPDEKPSLPIRLADPIAQRLLVSFVGIVGVLLTAFGLYFINNVITSIQGDVDQLRKLTEERFSTAISEIQQNRSFSDDGQRNIRNDIQTQLTPIRTQIGTQIETSGRTSQSLIESNDLLRIWLDRQRETIDALQDVGVKYEALSSDVISLKAETRKVADVLSLLNIMVVEAMPEFDNLEAAVEELRRQALSDGRFDIVNIAILGTQNSLGECSMVVQTDSDIWQETLLSLQFVRSRTQGDDIFLGACYTFSGAALPLERLTR